MNEDPPVMRVKPATPGLLIPVPEAIPPISRWLPEDGAVVPDTEYWRRRLRDGEVLRLDPPEPEPEA